MPWPNQSVLSMKKEIMEAIALGQERISSLARRYGVSRKTLYKWKERYETDGESGLNERSRKTLYAEELWQEDVVAALVKLRSAHPDWGAKKLRIVLAKKEHKNLPSASAMYRFLKKSGLIKPHKKRIRERVNIAKPFVNAEEPNALWTVDFKGWWRSRQNERMTALTIRDAYSRFVLEARFVRKCDYASVKAIFEDCFKKYGLPQAIQSDNGMPFRCVNAVCGLSALSAWWVSLGISLVRSRPGCPQDNGAHERMHRDMLLLEANQCSSQEELDMWRNCFNTERPHAALNDSVPADYYREGSRKYIAQAAFSYKGMETHCVSRNGIISIGKSKVFLSSALRGYEVGLLPRPEIGAYDVYFCEMFLGTFTLETDLFTPVEKLPAEAEVGGGRPLGGAQEDESSFSKPNLASSSQECNLPVTLKSVTHV